MTDMALPDVERALVEYLEVVTPWSWSTRVPNPRPAQFGVLSRTGGSPANIAQSEPTVLIECWGSSRDAAWQVVETTWPIVANLHMLPHQTIPHVFVADVDVTEPVNFPDPESGQDRYQFVAAITATSKEDA